MIGWIIGGIILFGYVGVFAYILWGPEPGQVKTCKCDACEPKYVPPFSPFVSEGLHLWVGKDGKIHFKRKSRILK